MIPKRNRIFVAFLATTLVAGGLAAPLAHYVWMAAGSHFGNTGHHDHSAEYPIQGDTPIPQLYSEVGLCTYAELFATHLSCGLASLTQVRPNERNVEHIPRLPDWISVDGSDKVLARGPPASYGNA